MRRPRNSSLPALVILIAFLGGALWRMLIPDGGGNTVAPPRAAVDVAIEMHHQHPFGIAYMRLPDGRLSSVPAVPRFQDQVVMPAPNARTEHERIEPRQSFRVTVHNAEQTNVELEHVKVEVRNFEPSPERSVVIWRPRIAIGKKGFVPVEVSTEAPTMLPVMKNLQPGHSNTLHATLEFSEPGLYDIVISMIYRDAHAKIHVATKSHSFLIASEHEVSLATHGPRQNIENDRQIARQILTLDPQSYSEILAKSANGPISLRPGHEAAPVDVRSFEAFTGVSAFGDLSMHDMGTSLLQRGPTGESYFTLAELVSRRGDVINAELILQEHILEYPRDDRALLDLMTLYSKEESMSGGVIETWLRMQDEEIKHTKGYFLGGAIHGKVIGDLESTREYLREGARAFPDSVEMLSEYFERGAPSSNEAGKAISKSCKTYHQGLLDENDRRALRHTLVSEVTRQFDRSATDDFRALVAGIEADCGEPFLTDISVMPWIWHVVPRLAVPAAGTTLTEEDLERLVASLRAHGNFPAIERYLEPHPSGRFLLERERFDMLLSRERWEEAATIGRSLVVERDDIDDIDVIARTATKYLISCILASRRKCHEHVGYTIEMKESVNFISGTRINSPRLSALAGISWASELGSPELAVKMLLLLNVADPWDYGGPTEAMWEQMGVLDELTAEYHANGESISMQRALFHIKRVLRLESKQLLADGNFLPDYDQTLAQAIEITDATQLTPTMSAIMAAALLNEAGQMDDDVHVVRLPSWDLATIARGGDRLASLGVGGITESPCPRIDDHGIYCTPLSRPQIAAEIKVRDAKVVMNDGFDIRAATGLLEEAVIEDPSNPSGWYFLAQAAATTGSFADCRKHAERGLALDSSNNRLIRIGALCQQ